LFQGSKELYVFIVEGGSIRLTTIKQLEVGENYLLHRFKRKRQDFVKNDFFPPLSQALLQAAAGCITLG